MLSLLGVPPAGERTLLGFATVAARRGRAVAVLELSWLRPELEDDPVASALAAAVRRLDPARGVPDDHQA